MPELSSLLHIPQHDIYHLVDSYVKIYPNFTKLYVFKSPVKVRISGYEEQNKSQANATDKKGFENPVADIVSVQRTKTHISDLVLCNDFTLFATFTFKSDRQDIKKCKRKMSNWLHSQQKLHGKFKYLIIPEFHKDKKSIHFHALINGYKGRLKKTGIKLRGREVYNLLGYRSGFSTVVKIDEVDKVSSYVKKYITKDMPHFSGKKRYWHSTGLIMPVKIQNPDIDPFTREEFTEEVKLNYLTIFRMAGKLQILN